MRLLNPGQTPCLTWLTLVSWAIFLLIRSCKGIIGMNNNTKTRLNFRKHPHAAPWQHLRWPWLQAL
jgi:hypothetical protein